MKQQHFLCLCCYALIKKNNMDNRCRKCNGKVSKRMRLPFFKKRIYTGHGYITVIALAGIWSISALTSLPGLAVSPISEKLQSVFPSATELDIQLLTTLPSLFIIPFILLVGFISEKVGYIRLLYMGLWLYFLSGALYFLCGSIKQLVIVSALLGVGAGIIIPLSTSLVSKFFSGKERTKQYGYVSALTNITLVVATAVTGYLADIQWRLPFLVYLLPIVSILLVPAINHAGNSLAMSDDVEEKPSASGGIDYRRLVKYMLYYLLITYLVMAISINLPFFLGKHGYDSGVSGIVTSIFFIAMMLPGFFLNRIIAVLKGNILLWSLLLIGLGLADIFFNSSVVYVTLGCIATGFGYGIAQPYIYDVTASSASPQKATVALALVMTMNYVAILISPFIVDYVQELARVESVRFPFAFNSAIAAAALLFMCLRRFYVKYNNSDNE